MPCVVTHAHRLNLHTQLEKEWQREQVRNTNPYRNKREGKREWEQQQCVSTSSPFQATVPAVHWSRSFFGLMQPSAALFFSWRQAAAHTHTLQCFLNSVPSPVLCLGEDKDYKTHNHLWIWLSHQQHLSAINSVVYPGSHCIIVRHPLPTIPHFLLSRLSGTKFSCHCRDKQFEKTITSWQCFLSTPRKGWSRNMWLVSDPRRWLFLSKTTCLSHTEE